MKWSERYSRRGCAFCFTFLKSNKNKGTRFIVPSLLLYEWNSECFLRAFREVTCVNTLPRLERSERLAPTRERTTPGWWKTSLKRGFYVLGVFWGVSLLPINTYFFLRQQEEYVIRHTPTPKNRSSLKKRIPHEEKGYVLSCRTPFIRHSKYLVHMYARKFMLNTSNYSISIYNAFYT